MLKERIQEISDFTKFESPYRKANKGWITQDVFLDLSPSSETFKQKDEAAKVILLWSPIKNLLSNIFLILLLGSLLVFTSLSFAKGKFNLNLFNISEVKYISKIDYNKASNTNQANIPDDMNSQKIEQNVDTNDLDEVNNKKSLDDSLIISDQQSIPREIDKKESIEKDLESNKGNKISENNKSKSNFI